MEAPYHEHAELVKAVMEGRAETAERITTKHVALRAEQAKDIVARWRRAEVSKNSKASRYRTLTTRNGMRMPIPLTRVPAFDLCRKKLSNPTFMNKSTIKGEALRKAILDAASKLFIERGIAGTSMRDIAVELGLTRTAVYYYFKNKEEILKGLTEDVTLAARRMSEKFAGRRDIDAAGAVRGLVEQYAGLILSRPEEFRVVDRNERDMPPKLQSAAEAARRGTFGNFSEVIQRGVDSGEFRRVDARVAALAVLGMCNWTAWWFKPQGRKSNAEIASLIADLAVHALRADARDRKRKATVPDRLQALRDDLDQITQLVSRRKS